MSKSKAPLHRKILKEMNDLTVFFVEKGLVDDQNLAYETQAGEDEFLIQCSNYTQPALVLKKARYEDLYKEQRSRRAFNLLMLDGAMVQMFYRFTGSRVVSYRLAFLPSPSLVEFQNDPELYLENDLFADAVDPRVVTVPLRFDFDDERAVNVDHPKSHLTLGQYSSCRIAASAPLTPYFFLEFIVRSFYNTASRRFSPEMPLSGLRMSSCLADGESDLIHIGVPFDPGS